MAYVRDPALNDFEDLILATEGTRANLGPKTPVSPSPRTSTATRTWAIPPSPATWRRSRPTTTWPAWGTS